MFASIALFAFFIGFAIFLLTTVLFLQGTWHYSTVRAGLAITPGPATAALFAVNAGRLSARFGRTMPAVAGASLMAVSAADWMIATPATPDYAVAFLPGLLVGGASAGLAQAPLFAAAGTLAPERATTGSAVLNMSRQIGSAVGVAVAVGFLGVASVHSLGAFHDAWAAEIGAGTLAGLAAAGTGRRSR